MILYHFTAAKLVNRIKREGITLGGVLDIVNEKLVLRRGLLWLTVNSDFHNQEWNSMRTIPYDRCEFRITVNVPADSECHIINWLEYCASGNISNEMADGLNAIGDPENWRLYRGIIWPKWFTAIDRKLIVAQ